MFASKATSPKVSLKVTFRDNIPDGGLTFTFTSPDARNDRQTVQDILIPYITANRAQAGGSGTPAAAGGTPTAAVSASASAPGTPGAMGTPGAAAAGGSAGKGKRKADEITPAGGGVGSAVAALSPAAAAKLKATNRLRLRVLNKNPNLKLLHRELVVARQITEEEFWDGREVS